MPPSPALAVLLRTGRSTPPPPDRTPLGRAALTLEAQGLPVVFADAVTDGIAQGHRAGDGGWISAALPVLGAHDRFPGHSEPQRWRAALASLGARPVANPPATTALLRDKLLCQQHLVAAGIAMPAVEPDPDAFADRLADWGIAFLKPRFGSLGRGVRRVGRNDPLPTELPGTAARPDPAILQRAVPPLRGAGLVLRLLLQRVEDGWVLRTPVARASDDDPVVNVDRGARAVPAATLVGADTLAEAERIARAAQGAVDHPHLVELGADLAVDPDGRPWLIELNGCPRGRLRALAARDPERFAAEHAAACEAPLRALARLCGISV